MPVESVSFDALGSRCHLFAVGVGAARLNEGRAWIAEMQARLTRFEPSSELSRFNASAGDWFDVTPELEQLLRAALVACELSDGLVNAAVLGSMHAIGYTRSLSLGPTLALAEAARPLDPLPGLLTVKKGRARLRAGAGVDLGGIAKGWLADRLSERLGENIVVNLGGDLRVRGAGPQGEGWPVGFGERTVLLCGQGAATSGTWRRRWGAYHHLIDPRTGLPCESDLSEVSVVAATGLEAEIFAKTALLLGSRRAGPFLSGCCAAWRTS